MRRFCSQCGQIFNLLSHPPSPRAHAISGATLAQRADDCEDTVRHRLTAYEKTTPPIEHYASGRYRHVDGTKP